jgi:hypothetical protein
MDTLIFSKQVITLPRLAARAYQLRTSIWPKNLRTRFESLLFYVLLGIASTVATDIAKTETADPVAPYRAAREAFLENFRVSRARDPALMLRRLPELQSIAARTNGEIRARALLEIGFIQRASNAGSKAVSSYTQAADVATQRGRSDIAFDAWIGLALTHSLFTKDHGAAAAALERAIAAAGANPTPKQRFDIARNLAELAAEPGPKRVGLDRRVGRMPASSHNVRSSICSCRPDGR